MTKLYAGLAVAAVIWTLDSVGLPLAFDAGAAPLSMVEGVEALINILLILGAGAFFVVGMLWYGALFGKVWQRAAGLTDEQAQSGNMAVIFGLAFAFEVLIAMVLWHLIARTDPPPHVVMMMAVGFAGGVMIPAVGIN
jgi:archaellum biogenesis protein FlaJ (TadC family)